VLQEIAEDRIRVHGNVPYGLPLQLADASTIQFFPDAMVFLAIGCVVLVDELGLKDQKITKKRAIELMLEDVNLLKRPLLMKGKTFGFKEDAWKEKLGL